MEQLLAVQMLLNDHDYQGENAVPQKVYVHIPRVNNRRVEYPSLYRASTNDSA